MQARRLGVVIDGAAAHQANAARDFKQIIDRIGPDEAFIGQIALPNADPGVGGGAVEHALGIGGVGGKLVEARGLDDQRRFEFGDPRFGLVAGGVVDGHFSQTAGDIGGARKGIEQAEQHGWAGSRTGKANAGKEAGRGILAKIGFNQRAAAAGGAAFEAARIAWRHGHADLAERHQTVGQDQREAGSGDTGAAANAFQSQLKAWRTGGR